MTKRNMKKKADEKKAKNSIRTVIKNDVYAMKLMYRSSKYYVTASIAMAIVNRILPLIEHTFLLAYIVNCIQNGKPFSHVLAFLIPVTVLVILKLAFASYNDTTAMPKAKEKVDRDIRLMLYEKAKSMDVASYDDPEFYNDFVWAMRDATSHIHQVLSAISTLISLIASALCTGIYISVADPFGIVIVAATVSVTIFLQIKFSKTNMDMWNSNNPIQRRRDYVSRVFFLSDYAKELRMGNMKDQLYEHFEKSSEDMVKNRQKYGKKLWFLTSAYTLFGNNLAFDGLYATYLLYKTIVKKAFSYGTMLALYNGTSNLVGSLSKFARVLPELLEHSMYIEKMRRFTEKENTVSDKGHMSLPNGGAIKLSNVDFKYPGSEKLTLSGINMEIRKGEKIAIVGYNGAGKSTLVKLIMRLYDPSAGNITYDGQSLSDYPLAEYRSRIGTLFQDYQIIASTLEDNVTMNADVCSEEAVTRALEAAGFGDNLKELSEGIKTPMTKEFDDGGVNLSGGEAQKVALSRVLYADRDIIILDEPSSALDPIAEYKLNQTVKEMAKDKTVIFISHRLSTTRTANCIYMLENGQIIESGSHEELIRQGGKYARMFNLQAEKYR